MIMKIRKKEIAALVWLNKRSDKMSPRVKRNVLTVCLCELGKKIIFIMRGEELLFDLSLEADSEEFK